MAEVPLNELALFAGAGGGILGGILSGFRTVCAVELDPYCREVLLRRQEEGHLPPFPIWDDIRTFDGRAWRGSVDVITAGFPCQPFSVAGDQRGKLDERNMWPETIRILREVEPRFAFLENVPNLLAHDYFGEILGDLANGGFNAEWRVVSAAEVGAPHLRKRLWIMAYAYSSSDIPDSKRNKLREERRRCEAGAGPSELGDDGAKKSLANTSGSRGIQHRRQQFEEDKPFEGSVHLWQSEPDVGRVADGVAFRVDRLKALGNGQVPQVAHKAWEKITGFSPFVA